MILLTHPTGNTFVRALLAALEQEKELDSFYTTVMVEESDWYIRILPQSIKKELLRRTYNLTKSKISTRPIRELVRLGASKFNLSSLTAHETGWASVDAIYMDLDQQVAANLKKHHISAVYCYEDAALHTFRAAKKLGLRCFYDLPIAYWETSQYLLREEAERLPEWEATLVGTRDSQAKLVRKTEEFNLADVIICPSKFVYNSLPKTIHQTQQCIIAEFGSPDIQVQTQKSRNRAAPLRLLFVGSMTQRKGLADLFAAMKLLKQVNVELVVMGSLLNPIEFYRTQLPNFTYETTRPHQAVLQLMQSCDVLVLPSIVEGRALVMQEAMSCGLPLIITPNTGGEDLIDEGKTGFLVPIRSPEKIAEKIAWFADHRESISEMNELVRRKAAEVTWHNYCQKILNVVQP